ncbi:hypothetical protein T492DRAFT_379292 [Pavlovales sp. CCMP2436]|nr:hypothetical protein T492DRAFT_379292 [Pavlovales sp. CCMP2436]
MAAAATLSDKEGEKETLTDEEKKKEAPSATTTSLRLQRERIEFPTSPGSLTANRVFPRSPPAPRVASLPPTPRSTSSPSAARLANSPPTPHLPATNSHRSLGRVVVGRTPAPPVSVRTPATAKDSALVRSFGPADEFATAAAAAAVAAVEAVAPADVAAAGAAAVAAVAGCVAAVAAAVGAGAMDSTKSACRLAAPILAMPVPTATGPAGDAIGGGAIVGDAVSGGAIFARRPSPLALGPRGARLSNSSLSNGPLSHSSVTASVAPSDSLLTDQQFAFLHSEGEMQVQRVISSPRHSFSADVPLQVRAASVNSVSHADLEEAGSVFALGGEAEEGAHKKAAETKAEAVAGDVTNAEPMAGGVVDAATIARLVNKWERRMRRRMVVEQALGAEANEDGVTANRPPPQRQASGSGGSVPAGAALRRAATAITAARVWRANSINNSNLRNNSNLACGRAEAGGGAPSLRQQLLHGSGAATMAMPLLSMPLRVGPDGMLLATNATDAASLAALGLGVDGQQESALPLSIPLFAVCCPLPAAQCLLCVYLSLTTPCLSPHCHYLFSFCRGGVHGDLGTAAALSECHAPLGSTSGQVPPLAIRTRSESTYNTGSWRACSGYRGAEGSSQQVRPEGRAVSFSDSSRGPSPRGSGTRGGAASFRSEAEPPAHAAPTAGAGGAARLLGGALASVRAGVGVGGGRGYAPLTNEAAAPGARDRGEAAVAPPLSACAAMDDAQYFEAMLNRARSSAK